MYNLWNNKLPFPKYEQMKEIKDIDYINVHTAVKGEYQFLLGAAIIKHQGIWHASWANSFRGENDDNTILAQKHSFDNGKTWTSYGKISEKTEGFGRSHGVFFTHEDKLYAFCPKARFQGMAGCPDMTMEAYVFNENDEWEYIGTVLDCDFWPMCEPLVLDNGTFIMAGLKIENHTASAAVALCDGKDITKWERILISNPHGFNYWGETTILKKKDKLIAIVRGGDEAQCALISESYDNGHTWSGLEKSNFKISNSKMYAGTLSNGNNYLIFNAKSENYRETLCIATGKELFDRIYVIRHGFDKAPIFRNINEWCYPYAYENDGNLYVIYAKNKEDCELAIIPIESLK